MEQPDIQPDIPAIETNQEIVLKLAASAVSEVSADFLQGMLDRMAVSFHKYGSIAEVYPDKVNALDSLRLRLEKYRSTRNKEYLIDVANFAMIEFILPAIRGAYFKNTDHEGSPGRVWNADDYGDKETSRRANDGTPQG